MCKALLFAIAATPFAAGMASGSVVYDNTDPGTSTTGLFVTGIPSIYFDDATPAIAAPFKINQFNIGYENLSSKSASNFDLLVQFYNTVNYAAASGVPVGTNPIGSLIDIRSLSVSAGNIGSTGLVSLPGTLPVATSSTIGFEFEFVVPGATSMSEANLASTIVPIFRQGTPVVGSSNPFFAYDYLDKSTIVGDSSSGDIFTFTTTSNVDAQIGAVAAPQITVASGQTYPINASTGAGLAITTVAGITINPSGTLNVQAAANHANRRLLVVTDPGLLIAGSTGNWTGLLDLSNNDMDLPGASLATVTDQVRQGYANGKWNGGGGIISSSAATNPAHLTALGVIQNNQHGSPVYTTFDGQTVGASDILLKYTYYGDANLDGQVDGSDYTLIDNGFNNHLTGWLNGDFNYDGVIDGSDYTLIDNAFDLQGASLAAQIDPAAKTSSGAAESAVPEPAAVSVLVTAVVSGLCRRKRPTTRPQ